MTEKPNVIFLDAVGTLFGIRGTVGEIYGAFARNAGVEAASEALNQAFFQSFKTSDPLAFGQVEVKEIPELEFQWWEAIARSTFEKVGVLAQFSDFRQFFRELYDYFATDAPWFVYEDVLPSLQQWQEQGIQLGIISNFDSRIYPVLEELQLRDFFRSITISSLVGTAKPNPEIFLTALEKHDCLASEAWHIGDSLTEDYEGAKAVGIRAILIERNS